jgi:hypothetical protein
MQVVTSTGVEHGRDHLQILGPNGRPKPGTTNYGIFAQTANSIPITNTTSELTLIDGGVGTLTIPPNAFSVGDSFLASMTGIISSANNETIQIKVKSGLSILGDSGLITLPQTTVKHFDLRIVFTVRQIGAAGTASIAVAGEFTYSKDASNAFEGDDFSTINTTTFDTTTSNTLDITAQWGSAKSANIIYSEVFILNKTF